MSIKSKIIHVLYFIFISIIALVALGLTEVPEFISVPKIVQVIIEIPTEKDLKELQQSFADLEDYLKQNEVVKEQIETTYTAVTESPVCSIANRNFNTLAEQYEEYNKQLSEIQKQFEKIEKRYERYLRLLNNIPEFSKGLIEKKNNEFQEVIVPLYEVACNERQGYLSDKEAVDNMYQSAKKIADDFFEEYYDLMCHIVNAEAGWLDYSSVEDLYSAEEIEEMKSMERCCVANVIENRIKSSAFPNTLYAVIHAPGQYAPVKNGSINLEPYLQTRIDMENYLRGRVETGMPDTVVYQALFQQPGKEIWGDVMPSGHYFCHIYNAS